MRPPSATGMRIAFEKVEGLGNDFVLVDRREWRRAEAEAELTMWADRAPRWCDRRRGIGADGILVVAAPLLPGSMATMWVINADGSRPEMCGNGIRCAAHVLAGSESATPFSIDTDAGPRICEVTRRPGGAEVRVEMGAGRDDGSPQVSAHTAHPFRSVSMGNPHAVAFVGADEDPQALARQAGPGVERDPAFPDGTNVEFARVHPGDPTRITLWVWERGVGITDACGTGACATACAAAWGARSPLDRPIVVDLPGGPLTIVVPSDRSAPVQMTGPARTVFRGTIEG